MGRAATPATSCRNCLRESFILNPPSPTLPSITSSGGRLWPLCVRTSRQAHHKRRTFAEFARDGHIAAHQARELAGDGKAEPRAAEVLSGCGIGLTEFF